MFEVEAGADEKQQIKFVWPYGDPAYGLSKNILSPFRGVHMTPQEQEFNQKMSAVRVSVEWAFGKILQYFPIWTSKRIKKSLCNLLGNIT